MKQPEIYPYHHAFKPQILQVWERSVLATHHFLSHADFLVIQQLVAGIDFDAFAVHCLMHGEEVIGFNGVAERKVEMLFLDPSHFRKGYGQFLLQFAVSELHANLVDVNLQNTKALKFYQRFGFEAFEQTEKDNQGRNYPLLRLRLRPHSPQA